MGILPLKKRVNRDKCSFTTKQRMFGVFAIDEILRYRGTRFPGSRTLCHPVPNYSLMMWCSSRKSAVSRLQLQGLGNFFSSPFFSPFCKEILQMCHTVTNFFVTFLSSPSITHNLAMLRTVTGVSDNFLIFWAALVSQPVDTPLSIGEPPYQQLTTLSIRLLLEMKAAF